MIIEDLPQNIKDRIIKKVQREFPGCKPLQDIHYYRYAKEIIWESMSSKEIVRDIKEGVSKFKKGIKEMKEV